MFGNFFDMFSNILNSNNIDPNAMATDVDQLREDATQTARDIVTGVQENFVSNSDFLQFNQEMESRFNQLDQNNQTLLNAINSISDRININENNNGYERLNTPTPTPIADQQVNDNDDESSSSATTSTHYDLDHDVIMKSRFAYTVTQVPDPGLFTGKTSETELFCQLCEDNFKTYPHRYWPEDSKVNFVKSRLRGSARSWYLTKYKDNVYPATLKELLDGLKKAFTNVASVKLAKIKLVNLKQSYGKIDEYIEEFRSYIRQFNWSDETLALFFYAGLHVKYQEEINKAEVFPTKLEDIITKVILFENSLNTKSKIREVSQNKNSKKKSSNSNFNNKNNNKNNFNKNNNRYSNYQKSNNYNNFNNNKNNDYISNVQKINTKN